MTYSYKHITKEKIEAAFRETQTAAQAAHSLNIPYNSFRRLCVFRGVVFKTNQSRKGIKRSTEEIKKVNKPFPLKEILKGKYPTYQTFKLKNKLIAEGLKKEQCEQCKLTEWQGQKIPLELHHLDGNKRNHKWKNLEIICPNCHALTDNYCSKNKFFRPCGEIGDTRLPQEQVPY